MQVLGGRVELGYGMGARALQAAQIVTQGWWGCRDPCGRGIQDELCLPRGRAALPWQRGRAAVGKSTSTCPGRGTGTLGFGGGAGTRGHMGILQRTAAPTGSQSPPSPTSRPHTHRTGCQPHHVPHTQCAALLAPPIECVHTAGSVSSTHTSPLKLCSPGERAGHSR